MKLLLIIMILLGLMAIGFGAVITSSPYNINSAGATLAGLLTPGTNGNAWFEFGVTTAYGSYSATNAITSTNAEIETTVPVTGLKSRVPYHYRLVFLPTDGTNSLGQDVTFTTGYYTYDYDGLGLVSVDTTRPQDYEPGSVLGASFRQFKQQFLGSYQKTFNLDGTMLPSMVQGSNIAPSSISMSKLDTNLQQLILSTTNATAGSTPSVMTNLSSPLSIVITNEPLSITNCFTMTDMTNAFKYISFGASFRAIAHVGGYHWYAPGKNVIFPVVVTVDGATKWSDNIVVYVPALHQWYTNTSIASFVCAISSGQTVNVNVGTLTGWTSGHQSQQFVIDSLLISGYP